MVRLPQDPGPDLVMQPPKALQQTLPGEDHQLGPGLLSPACGLPGREAVWLLLHMDDVGLYLLHDGTEGWEEEPFEPFLKNDGGRNDLEPFALHAPRVHSFARFGPVVRQKQRQFDMMPRGQDLQLLLVIGDDRAVRNEQNFHAFTSLLG